MHINPNAKRLPQAVALLTHVEIELLDAWGEAERLAFDIVPDDQADYYAGFLGVGTPLAKAILGCRVGNVVVYKAGEETLKVRILAIQPVVRKAGAEAEARRAAVDQARQQIASTDAMIFASTVEGKWGEYETEATGPFSLPDTDRAGADAAAQGDRQDEAEESGLADDSRAAASGKEDQRQE